jgi:hypothetical protein
LPDDWVINISDLKNRSKNGRDAASSALNELMGNGYAERVEGRDNFGRFMYEYTVFEQPQSGFTVTDKPKRISRNGKTVTDKPILQNTNPLNTNKENTNESEEKKLKIFPTHTLEKDPDNEEEKDLHVIPTTTQITHVIKNGVFISTTKEETEKPTESKGGVRILLTKDKFVLAENALKVTTEAQINGFGKLSTIFKAELLEKYFIHTMIDYFDTEEGRRLEGIDAHNTKFVIDKFEKYSHFIIEKVNKANPIKNDNENLSADELIQMTRVEYIMYLQSATGSKKMSKEEADKLNRYWGMCFPNNMKGTIAGLNKWIKEKVVQPC